MHGENLQEWIKHIGYLGIWAIIFAESGLMIGFFLPGDSLLFTAGFLASQNFLNIFVLIFGAFACAVFGDNVGYATGHRFGRRLFQKEDSRIFKRKYLIQTQNFYAKHGQKTIVLARFMPIVRTFAPIVAGTAAMRYKTFMTYNLIGGAVWTVGVTLLGFFLGKVIPDVDKYLLPIIAVIILVSIAPSIWHVVAEHRSAKNSPPDEPQETYEPQEK
ncbi:VTT domain-containing protein [Oscillatoria sp. FACHB-1406]|uniref:DedA family protein n=1 Tax=Oscillatoria sp. FACHB-1406 TaxID=2692846 RepID=UPI00168482F0|nr:VTT domain-containing protein [Oscillatoria sp. FACHB-1406]MBD2580469.1 VTT domain-containing protein [Oscillatoria sp. FACHB-1406]